jgi:D-alanine--poly(phosphoribitol) ligase subunit 1
MLISYRGCISREELAMTSVGRRTPRAGQPLIHKIFESHAARWSERTALTCGDVIYTYRELNARANQVAHYLMAKGFGKSSVIGVCLDRSPDMAVSVLGILKAGAAYAPLDTTYPAGRLRVMRSQLTRMKLIVASSATVDMTGTSGAEILNMSEEWPRLSTFPTADPVVDISAEDLCYVVFTSGSTGTPKAVAVRHEGWYNLLQWLVTQFHLGAHSSGLLLSPAGFDISQRGLMAPLFTGSVLHLLPSRHFDVLLACRLMRQRAARTLHCAPSALYLMVDTSAARNGHDLDSLDFAFVGGEPLVAQRVADWATGPGHSCRLVNVYGVAECTDVATAHVLTDYAAYAAGGVPIGRPIGNVDVHLLDEGLEQVPQGSIGEICISGLGVGAGYLNDSNLNAERFIQVGSGDHAVRLYRSGDLGWLRPDGELMYAGRADRQVKIRGMRVDLGDVEAALAGDESVRDAVVLLGLRNSEDSHEPDLVAFVVPAAEAAGVPEEIVAMRRKLLDILPWHMVPGRIVYVRELPLTPNGKVDRDALALSLR